MEWSERSFLLDVKPNGCFGNLFINCPEGEKRDFIRILKDGVELASNGGNGASSSENILNNGDEAQLNSLVNELDQLSYSKDSNSLSKNDSSLKATVDGLLLCPDTVTNYAWTDDHQTFSCKLKVERWEECYFSPKTLKATLKILSTDLTLDQFCQQNSGQEVTVQCHQCGKGFLKESSKITRVFPLPSTNYGETADEWFCCCSHHRDHRLDAGDNANGDSGDKSACSHASASSSIRLGAPNTEQCFIGDSHFLLNGKIIDNICVVDVVNNRTPILTCVGCQNQLGNIEIPRGLQMPKDETLRFYHSAIDFQRKSGDSQRNYLSSRFRGRERYFAWLLLSECEQQSSLKFALKTIDNHPALLVWLLDSYSIMVNGNLSDVWNTAPFKPFPILKMLYKKLDDSDMSDPRVTGEDGSVGRISLPRESCDELTDYLCKSTISLPPACRAVGQFSVGYIKMAASL